MSDQESCEARTNITITGLPSLHGGGAMDKIREEVLTNVDAEFTPKHIEALDRAAKAMILALAVAEQSGGSISFETLVAFMVSAFGRDSPAGEGKVIVSSTEREITLARGVLALLRALECAPDPDAWEVQPAPWGDGRTTYEVRGNYDDGTNGRLFQFRPDDEDGTEDLAEACVDSARRGVKIARDVLAQHRQDS